jgi:putative membrane protein
MNGGFLLLGFCFLALVGIVLLVVLVLQPSRTAPQPPPAAWAPPPVGPPPVTPARAILDERLARGEITVEEYQRLRAALDG